MKRPVNNKTRVSSVERGRVVRRGDWISLSRNAVNTSIWLPLVIPDERVLERIIQSPQLTTCRLAGLRPYSHLFILVNLPANIFSTLVFSTHIFLLVTDVIMSALFSLFTNSSV